MLAYIKACYGLTTAVLASFLGGSIHTVYAVFADKKPLSPERWEALQLLYKALEADKDLSALTYASHYEQSAKPLCLEQLVAEHRRLGLKLNRKQKQLTWMQSRRAQWLRGWHACRLLLASAGGKQHQKWLLLREKNLRLKLQELNRYKLLSLEAEIKGLESRLAFLQVQMRE